MFHLSSQISRAAAALIVAASIAAAACSDDEPQAVQQAAQQPAAQEQTEPIDASESQQAEQAAQPEAQQAAQPEPQPEEQAQPEPEQQEAPAQEQPSQAEPADDPNRDTLVDGERFAATLSTEVPERQFRFQAAAGAWLRIRVDGKNGMDPVVTLLQPDSVEIGVNDDQSTTNRDSLLIAQVSVEGEQLIRVQPYDSASMGDFEIQVQTLTVGNDDDNRVMTLGSSANGVLNTPGDVDVFEFQVAEGQQIFVLVDGDTGVDVFAQVFNPDGELEQIDDDGGHGLDAEVYLAADTAGLWRVEVWPASNRAGQRQLIGAYRVTVEQGLPTEAVTEAVAADLSGAALTFLQALRDADSATILALAGPEALTIWGWESTDDVGRDIAKLQSIDLGGEILQTTALADRLHAARGRVYFQLSEELWIRFELIQLAGLWLIDDWAHSIGPPS